MIETIHHTIANAAKAAGLPETKIMSMSERDNLTIPRPRIEYQILPEHYERTGRALAAHRTGSHMDLKRELYQVTLGVNVNVLADDDAWLADFCMHFVSLLPAGLNDPRGNWVKIRVQEARLAREPVKRVGLSVIKVFNKVSRLYLINFVWRVTDQERKELIETITFNPPKIGGKHE